MDHTAFHYLNGSMDELIPQSSIKHEPLIRFTGEIEINGVYISQDVARQLSQGFAVPLEWLTREELVAANQSHATDATVIDDPHGITKLDKMELTAGEQKSRARKKSLHHQFMHSIAEACESDWDIDEATPWPNQENKHGFYSLDKEQTIAL